MSELTGSGCLAGASGAAVNEFIQAKLAEAFKDDPAMHQWASAIVGAAVSGVVSGNAQAGVSSAVSGTKHNNMHNIDFIKNSLKKVDINELKDGEIFITQGSVDLLEGSITGGSMLLENGDVFDFIAVGKGNFIIGAEYAEFKGNIFAPELDANGNILFAENNLPKMKKNNK